MFFPHIGDGAGGYTRAPSYHTDVHADGGEDTLTKLMAGDRDGDGLVGFSHVRTDDGGKVIMINHFSDGAGGFTTAPTFRTQTHNVSLVLFQLQKVVGENFDVGGLDERLLGAAHDDDEQEQALDLNR